MAPSPSYLMCNRLEVQVAVAGRAAVPEAEFGPGFARRG